MFFTGPYAYFGTFAAVDPTQPNPQKIEKNLDPNRPNQTHGSTQPMDNSGQSAADAGLVDCWPGARFTKHLTKNARIFLGAIHMQNRKIIKEVFVN